MGNDSLNEVGINAAIRPNMSMQQRMEGATEKTSSRVVCSTPWNEVPSRSSKKYTSTTSVWTLGRPPFRLHAKKFTRLLPPLDFNAAANVPTKFYFVSIFLYQVFYEII